MASTARRDFLTDEREFRIRMTQCPWAYALMELVLMALSTASEFGPNHKQLYAFSEGLEGAMRLKSDVTVEEARLVLEWAWKAEMEREARLSKMGWEKGW